MQADAVIVGGGPAGLGAALSLARLRKRTIILQSGKYRNESADVMHNVIAFDGAPPATYRQQAHREVDAYGTTTVVDHEAAKVEQTQLGFTVDGKYSGKILVIATGVQDELEGITGLKELWGKTVVHCPFCHGTEHADQPGALLGLSSLGIKMAGWFSISSDLQLLTNGEPIDERSEQAVAVFIKTGKQPITAKIARLESDADTDGITVHFQDDTPPLTLGFVAYAPPFSQASSLASQLGLDMTPTGDIAVTGPFNATSMKGVFACGDAAMMAKAVPIATASGCAAGAGAAMRLGFESLGMPSPI